MEFDYTSHDRTGIKLPKASEELVETLEDNQVVKYTELYLDILKWFMVALRTTFYILEPSAEHDVIQIHRIL